MRGNTIIFDTDNSFYVYNSLVYTKNQFQKATPFIFKNGKWQKCDVNYRLGLLDFDLDYLGEADLSMLLTADKVVRHKLNLMDDGVNQLIDKNGKVIYSLSHKETKVIDDGLVYFIDRDDREFITSDDEKLVVKER